MRQQTTVTVGRYATVGTEKKTMKKTPTDAIYIIRRNERGRQIQRG